MSTGGQAQAWSPLRIAVYRNLWLALLAANIGTWMQTVGAQWLLVNTTDAETLVAAVQTASMLPILLFALPAGVLADAFDRRYLLISVQGFLATVGIVMTVLTATGHMGPALLLTLTFALGTGQAVTLPAWAAVIPQLVPRDQIRPASALGAISVNVARAIGPAVAGVLIAEVGIAFVFGLNAATFVLFAATLIRWKPRSARPTEAPERFTAALRAGGRYVRYSPTLRHLLLRIVLFILPGSALWALLPLVASERLGTSSHGYGLLLAALGVGAIAGGIGLPRLRSRMSASKLLGLAGVIFGLSLLDVATLNDLLAVTVALAPAGAAWVIVLANLNAEIQLFLPNWVRARGLAVYQVVFAGGQALGALAWGAVAQVVGLELTFLLAAVIMLLDAVALARWPLPDLRDVDREPAVIWPEVSLGVRPDPEAGPVLVASSYDVRPEREKEFMDAMRLVRGTRMRTGARRWGLFRVGEEPHRFVEVYQIATWGEHLRQHDNRFTGADQETEERVNAIADESSRSWHLLPAESVSRDPGAAADEAVATGDMTADPTGVGGPETVTRPA
ncbi:MFS transporter [Phytohabitans sp. ZYX-F-186]|uniref:MFS transporter n=1 Tax=Phytohabitans maris TaxID=3071409 RepID=A0ABU0ZUT3_9ACTN|nr:MFS transporter [Phytohabitans sp. ZYX-F-186]MDQ7910703.1 MFS transporter [Phytohabitans sp. ZYX-F-186]